jgi:phage shock protein PspC (stress-responsive transcriptional regulator)
LTLSLVPLTLGIVIDAYLIGWLFLRREAPSLWLAGGLFVALIGLWFAMPQVAKRARPARLPRSNIEG